MTRLGEQLLRHGLLDPRDLEAALERQSAQGGYLGQHLVDGGFVTRQQLYDGLAEQWDLPRRDLDRDPPDPAMVREVDLERFLELGWVPCEVTPDGHVVVATTVRPGPDVVDEVHDVFPAMPVRFVASTRRDLDRLAARLRPGRRERPGQQRAAEPRRGWCRGLTLRDLWIGLAAVVVLTVVLAAPLSGLVALLTAAAAVFLLGVVVQCAGAVSVAVRSSRPAPAAGAPASGTPANELTLPTYSILVAVAGGAVGVRRALDCLARLDYPATRKDAVLLVDETDASALAAVRRSTPPSWVRLAVHPPTLTADPVAVYDEGLVLARGRYVVAYSTDDSPAPDQLSRAVSAFEADLDENLTIHRERPALAGLRVAVRTHERRWSVATMLAQLDRTLVLDRAYPWRGAAVELRHELTSVHFNTRVLRRLGGWRFAVTGEAGVPARMGRLDSVTRVRNRPRLSTLVADRAVDVERCTRRATARARQVVPLGGPAAPSPTEVVAGFATPAMLLAYPLGLLASGALVLRRAEATVPLFRLGLVGLVVMALGLLLAMGIAGVLGGLRQGWPALVGAILLPALWLVHAAAAWYAALVLLPCHPPDPAAAPTPGLGGRLG